MSAVAPTVLRKPFYAGVTHRVNIAVFSDGPRKRAKSVVGKTLTAKFSDAGGVNKTYSVTLTNATLGVGYFSTTGASHTTIGTVNIQVLIDSVPRERYTGEIVTAL